MFFRKVSTLVTGTVIAQIFPILLSPLLTRIYGADQFGLFALYVSVVSIVGVVAAGRYELAIVQPKKDSDALAVLVLCLLITLIVSFITGVFFGFVGDLWLDFETFSELSGWAWLVSVAVFFSGTYLALSNFALRGGAYRVIASANALQGVSGSSSQALLGFLPYFGGLIVGNLLGAISSVVQMLYGLRKQVFPQLRHVTFNSLRRVAKSYAEFPKYSVAGALANVCGQQAPVFFLSVAFSSSALGLYALTLRVLSIPASLVSNAVSQVVFKHVVDQKRESKEGTLKFLLMVFLGLSLLFLPVTLLFVFFGQPIFAFVFGEEWREAGLYAGVLCISIGLKFAVSPLSIILSIKGNVLLGTAWQLCYFFGLVVLFFNMPVLPILSVLSYLVAYEVVLYLLFLVLILGVSYKLN